MDNGKSEMVYTIDNALDSLGFGLFHVLILFYAGLSWMAEAMEMMLLSFVGPAIRRTWNLSPKQESFISSAVFAGMMIGAYIWGLLSDWKGRRTGFFATSLLIFLAGFLSSFAPNYYALLSLRALVGVGLGGGHVVLSWFMEFIPSSSRGMWMVVFSSFWTLGSIAEAILAWIVMPTMGWRWLLAFSSFPLVIFLGFYTMVPESPRYLMAKGEIAKASRVLKMMAAVNRKKLPPGRLISLDEEDHEITNLIDTNKSEVILPTNEPICSNSSSTMEEKGCQRMISSFMVLLSPSLIVSTSLVWTTFFANTFVYYGLILLTSLLSNGGPCKGEPLSPKPSSNMYKDVLITSIAELPGLAVAAMVVDSYGRKHSMAALLASCSLFLFPLMWHQPEAVTTLLLFGARACIMGSYTILYIYAPEVYPTGSRSTALGSASSFARLGGMLCPLVAVGLIRACQRFFSVLVFTLIPLVAALAVLNFPMETSRRSLSDTFKFTMGKTIST